MEHFHLCRLGPSLLAYISLHAYGQSWLTPWGYTTHRWAPIDYALCVINTLPKVVFAFIFRADNYEDFKEFAELAFKQIECSYGRAVPAREGHGSKLKRFINRFQVTHW